MFWSRGGKTHSQARLWGLAAGGILTRLNSENFDRIRFRCGREASRVCLRDWWSVNDPASLQDKLQWLWNRGHSGSCMELCDALSSSNAGQIAAEQGISSALCTFMLGNRNELRASRLVAWDLSRLVNVARWGYTAGLMPKADAWSWIMLAARKLQTSFRSWQSLGQDFILGCEFWALSTGATEEIDLAPSYNWLVSSPESPWVQLPWETPLGA